MQVFEFALGACCKSMRSSLGVGSQRAATRPGSNWTAGGDAKRVRAAEGESSLSGLSIINVAAREAVASLGE